MEMEGGRRREQLLELIVNCRYSYRINHFLDRVKLKGKWLNKKGDSNIFYQSIITQKISVLVTFDDNSSLHFKH